MSEETPEVVDWSGLMPEPTLEETPTDVREAFATPNFRAHGRNKRKLFSARKAAADSATPRQRTVKEKSVIPNRKGQFIEPLTRIYVSVGGIVSIRDPHCGRIIVMQAEAAATSLDDLAYSDEFTRRLLWTVTQTGKYGAVIGAHAPILIAVLIHHVPAISEAMTYIGQQFAESVVRGEANNGTDATGHGNVNGATR